MAEQAPMGWYDDPTQPGTQRFWDGTAWTEDHRPSTREARSAPRTRSLHPLTSEHVRDQRFDSSFRGYAEAEVNAFLERAANSLQHLENGRPGGCTSTDVARVTFRSTFGGLSEQQVDAFLDRVAAALRTYEQTQRQQRKRRASTTRRAKAALRIDVETVAPGEPVTAAEVSERSFPEERSGYTQSRVDDLLRRAAESLEAWESGKPGELTSDEAAHARFFIDIRGYPKREVDEFVGRIVSTLRRYEQEI